MRLVSDPEPSESGAPRVARAIIVSTDAGAADRLDRVIHALASYGVSVDIESSVGDAVATILSGEGSFCVMVDSRGRFDEIVSTLREALPGCLPVVLFASPSAELAITGFRAGASDLLDTDAAAEAEVARMLARLEERIAGTARRKRQLTALATAMDGLLKAVVQTERRLIDLETQLAQRTESARTRRTTDEIQARRPVVLIVEDDREVSDLLVDRLEDMGLVTFAFMSSEEALQHSRLLADNAEPIDFAILATRLRGVDWMATLHALRDHRPELPALLLTPTADSELALAAAEQGITDVIRKPFEDTAAILDRIRTLALEAMQSGRERLYLVRIKRRHEGVLNRYRELRAMLEEMET